MLTDNLKNATPPHKRKTVLPCGVLDALIEDFADGKRRRVGLTDIIPTMPERDSEVKKHG